MGDRRSQVRGRMKWQIIHPFENQVWHHLLKRFPDADIYFLPEYHRSHELNGDGEACAFVFEQEEQVLFYPFFMRQIVNIGEEPVSGRWYDLETVYGYSGPLCTTTDESFLEQAWMTFAKWCQEKCVVAEFIRFNPVLVNFCSAGSSCSLTLDRETVTVRLDCSESELWASYPQVHRNMVRKAIGKSLVCEPVSLDEGMTEFKRLYAMTMDRAGAHPYYYFSGTYFSHVADSLGEHVRLFQVRDQDRTIAASLFFVYDGSIYYHLSGSHTDYLQSAPNNLLLHGVADWGRKNGFQQLFLGGGRTSAPGDSLFRFKAGLSRLRLPFYTGRRVHNRQAYEALCAQWMLQAGVIERPNYFLLYRMEQNH